MHSDAIHFVNRLVAIEDVEFGYPLSDDDRALAARTAWELRAMDFTFQRLQQLGVLDERVEERYRRQATRLLSVIKSPAGAAA